jgi:predicted Rossmann-fold nucleotide-binding protein
VTTWAQLGLHRKPIGLLNVAGYFDLLLEFAGRMVAEGFLSAAHRRLLVTATSAADLLAGLRTFRPPVSDKWPPPQP